MIVVFFIDGDCMTKKKSSAYWKDRFEILEKASNAYGHDAYRKIEPAFNKAQREIEAEIEKWYARIAKNNEIDIVEARKLLNASELKEFKWDVREYIKYGRENELNQTWMKELENASAKYHISRLEALKLRTQNAMEVAFGNELDEIDLMARKVFSENYYHSIFEVQKGFNIGWEIGQIDERKLEKIISKPWTTDNKTFSDRVWNSKTQMVNELHQQMTRTFVLGKSPDEAIKEMSKFVDKKFTNVKAQAGRLVMTEQAYFHSISQKEAFNELDVEEFEVVATLDSHTSEICQDMDGIHKPMKEYEVGVTAPPFHVFCRSVTVPYFEDNFTGQRAARDAETGETYYVPDNMTYKDWKRKQDELYGAGTVDKKRKMAYNESVDKSQFARYKDRLGADAPRSLKDFQKIKYDEPTSYDDLKGYYRYKGENPESSIEFYNADKVVQKLRVDEIIRATGVVTSAPKGKKIVFPNGHTLERMIERNITLEKAQSFIDDADFALKQRKGLQYAYYTSEGFAVLDNDGVLRSVGMLDEGGKKLYQEVMKIVKVNK